MVITVVFVVAKILFKNKTKKRLTPDSSRSTARGKSAIVTARTLAICAPNIAFLCLYASISTLEVWSIIVCSYGDVASPSIGLQKFLGLIGLFHNSCIFESIHLILQEIADHHHHRATSNCLDEDRSRSPLRGTRMFKHHSPRPHCSNKYINNARGVLSVFSARNNTILTNQSISTIAYSVSYLKCFNYFFTHYHTITLHGF